MTPGSRNILITSIQGYEDTIENMKIQFTAISEQKAEVERKLKPLVSEFTKLSDEMDESKNRKEDHSVSSSRGPLCYRDTNSSDSY